MLFCTGSLFKIAHFEKCVSSFLFSAPSYRPTLVYDHDCFAVSKHPQSRHLFEKGTARLSPPLQARVAPPPPAPRQRTPSPLPPFPHHKPPLLPPAHSLPPP